MGAILIRNAQRHSLRRGVMTPCSAVSLSTFDLLGQEVLDLSPQGMLVSCGGPAQLGDRVFVSFKAPGSGGLWLHAEAEVARIVNGWRRNDDGYCVGVHLSYFNAIDRRELNRRLAGRPPPLPKRRMRMDYAETVRNISDGFAPLPPARAHKKSVSAPQRWRKGLISCILS